MKICKLVSIPKHHFLGFIHFVIFRVIANPAFHIFILLLAIDYASFFTAVIRSGRQINVSDRFLFMPGITSRLKTQKRQFDLLQSYKVYHKGQIAFSISSNGISSTCSKFHKEFLHFISIYVIQSPLPAKEKIYDYGCSKPQYT